tara:strand:- start:527 stop:1543 length:1017 start_codon:yes stop_codon:yes gene_type:complete
MSAMGVGAEVAQEAALHHEAFLIEIFGESATTKDRLRWLTVKGYIDKADIGRLAVKTSVGSIDPMEFVMHMTQLMSDASPEEVVEMRRWKLGMWRSRVDEMLRSQGAPLPEPAINPPTQNKPVPAPVAGPTVPLPSPDRLGTGHQAAYEQAYTRSGEYVRGLGNKVGEDGRAIVLEEWAGEDITMPVDEAKRGMRIDDIRAEVAEGVKRGDTARRVASKLGWKSDEWGRDWNRIAQTEMQGAYNDGQVIRAIKVYGDRARVARIPHPDACQYCISLFLEGGKPIIFSVEELVDNGTNVGRKAREWQATIWPVHPNCRCDTQVVPPNFAFNDEWILEPE